MTRVACIGAGSWGTVVANLAAANGGDVTLWCRRAEVADEIKTYRTNEAYLPGIRLDESLHATADLAEAVSGRDVVVMGVPSHGWRQTLQLARASLPDVQVLVSLTKGLEADSRKRMSEIVAEELPDLPPDRYAIMAGPNIAREIAKHMPAATVVACRDPARAELVQRIFHQHSFRVYANADVVGCELGGATKNIVAIAAGIVDTFGFGDNATAALITRGLAELTRLGVRLGGDPMTFAGLAGVGDLVVTCMSRYSRNRRVGRELGKGRRVEDITAEMKMVAEGVKTCVPVRQLAAEAGVDMPIVEAVTSVVTGQVTPEQAVIDILSRPPKPEVYGLT